MNKYYLFVIKKRNINIYKNKSYVLYKNLEKLYYLKAYDFSYGLNIYNTLCDNISVKLLNNYINSRIKHKRINNIIKIDKNNYLTIKRSCIIMYTNNKKNILFKIFNIYNDNIFVCDFKNNNYFWLNEYLKKGQFNYF